MDVVSVAKQIATRNKRLEELTAELKDAGDEVAAAISGYDTALAVAEVKLKYLTGVRLAALLHELPGIKEILSVEDIDKGGKLPATIIQKVAAGLCHSESLKVEQAKHGYKSLTSKIDTLCATLNSRQSIFRHLSHE
jgi:hypothetical protein